MERRSVIFMVVMRRAMLLLGGATLSTRWTLGRIKAAAWGSSWMRLQMPKRNIVYLMKL